MLVKVGGSALTDKAGVEVLKERELGETARQVERSAHMRRAAVLENHRMRLRGVESYASKMAAPILRPRPCRPAPILTNRGSAASALDPLQVAAAVRSGWRLVLVHGAGSFGHSQV